MDYSEDALLQEQDLILKEFNSAKKVQIIPFAAQATKFMLQDVVVELTDVECRYKKVIFNALRYVNYLTYQTDKLAKGFSNEFRTIIPLFVSFMNSASVTAEDKVYLFKKFESCRVNQGCKPQSTGLKKLKHCIKICLNDANFTENQSDFNLVYLDILKKTKVAPSAEAKVITLTHWLSGHTWLRRDDIGIGSELYSRLSSPKHLIQSFNTSIEVGLLEIQEAKYTLLKCFKDNPTIVDSISPWKEKGEFTLSNRFYTEYKNNHQFELLKLLQTTYQQLPEKPESLQDAFKLVICSLVHEELWDETIDLFFSNKNISQKESNIKGNISMSRISIVDSSLFSLGFLVELKEYSKAIVGAPVPCSRIEHQLFQWMMASLRVQTTDIYKLQLSTFTFTRRVNNSITHIDCNYFKGRAGGYHETETVSVNTTLGKGLLNFIKDRTENMSNTANIFSPKLPLGSLGGSSWFSKGVMLLSNSIIRKAIDIELKKRSLSAVFLTSMLKIIKHGNNYDVYTRQQDNATTLTRLQWEVKSESPTRSNTFGLSNIKNTAVHAKSDFFDPSKLLNFNSHSNKTERIHYLTPANEEWKNNCGLVTRAVMQDIQSNIFRVSQKDKEVFESEFVKASESIETKKKEILRRFKLITGRKNGDINELGISTTHDLVEGDLPDTIYLIDSPETVMKLKHYLAQSECHYQRIIKHNPEFVFNTLLPTLEWIEDLFYKKKFSEKSLSAGEEMFARFREILPPIFQAQGGL
jgi:hypothetical protein